MAVNTPEVSIAMLVFGSANTDTVHTVGSRVVRGATPVGGIPNVAAVNFSIPGTFLTEGNATVPAGRVNPTGTIARTSEVLRDGVGVAQGILVLAPVLYTCTSPG